MTAPMNPYADSEALRIALAQEERQRPAEIHETPQLARTDFVMNPLVIPRKQADLDELARQLMIRYHLKVDRSQYGSMYNGATDQMLLNDLVARDETLRFQGGMMTLEMPKRHTPIISVTISNEVIGASVAGSTIEATYIARQVFGALWTAAGVDREWPDDQVQLVGYMTTSTADLGVDLEDLFSPVFRSFVADELEAEDSLGAKMGRHLSPSVLASVGGQEEDIRAAHVYEINMRVCRFNPTSGRTEDCDVRLLSGSRALVHHGQMTATTELDSQTHTQFLGRLRSTILGNQ